MLFVVEWLNISIEEFLSISLHKNVEMIKPIKLIIKIMYVYDYLCV